MEGAAVLSSSSGSLFIMPRLVFFGQVLLHCALMVNNAFPGLFRTSAHMY